MLGPKCFPRFWPLPSPNIRRNVYFSAQNSGEAASLGSFLAGRPSRRHVVRAASTTMPSAGKDSLVLKYTKVLPEAHPPTKGSLKAAGYDLRSAVDSLVPARGKALVDTGLKVELPMGCYGRIAPRSGLAVKNFIDVGAGVVDEDYRGVLKVVLFNHSDADFEIKKGDRIAQLICEKIYYPELEEVQELTETDRGEGGFGSTGTN